LLRWQQPTTVIPLHQPEDHSRETEDLIDGRIIFAHKSSLHEQSSPEIQIKYQSLNPAPQFREVVDAARSVILAGGTMSPVGTHPMPVSFWFALKPATDIRLYQSTLCSPTELEGGSFLL
jgi:hypothetical protein